MKNGESTLLVGKWQRGKQENILFLFRYCILVCHVAMFLPIS